VDEGGETQPLETVTRGTVKTYLTEKNKCVIVKGGLCRRMNCCHVKSRAVS
jgi:hypothetical protein